MILFLNLEKGRRNAIFLYDREWKPLQCKTPYTRRGMQRRFTYVLNSCPVQAPRRFLSILTVERKYSLL